MENNGNLESFFEKAEQQEKGFNWLVATEVYEEASSIAIKESDLFVAAKIIERAAHAYERAAFQADTNTDFRAIIKKSIEAYEKVADLQKSRGEKSTSEEKHVKAMAANARSKLESDPSRKIQLIMQCWNLENQVLKETEETGDLLKISKTSNSLLTLARTLIWIPLPPLEKEKIVKELLDLGERTIKLVSKLDDDHQKAIAYNAISAYYISYLGHRPSQIERDVPEELTQKCLDYSKKALNFSKKSGDAWLIGSSNIIMGFAINTCSPGQSWIEFFKDALKYGEITRDNYLKATANLWIGMYFMGAASFQENPDNKRFILQKALNTSQDSIDQFHIIDFFLYIMLSYRTKIQSLTQLASLEIDVQSKRVLLEKAIQSGLEGLKCVSQGKSRPEPYILHGLGSAYHNLAMVETQINEKKRLLAEALKHIETSIRIEKTSKFKVFGNYSQRGLILSDVAKLEKNKAKKVELLNYAVSSMEDSVKLISAFESSGFAWLGVFYFWFGRILDQLYTITGKIAIIGRAIEVYRDAIHVLEKAKLEPEVAESYWQVAKLHDLQGDYLNASENYEAAAEKFLHASQKIPQLKNFYKKHSLYMKAWSQIENARYFHSIEEYSKANQHYEKAAELHESTDSWSYLAPNYFAWAKVEEAESLSRNEKTKKAKQMFQKALELFNEVAESIKEKLEKIASEEEKDVVQRLLKSSYLRFKYCQTRILMEEAKLLEGNGKYLQSSKIYGKAAQEINSIIKIIETESERKELRLILVLCSAWEKMALAEGTTSPQLFLEAAELFEKVKNLSLSQKTSLWALGNSSFCKGLAAGIDYQSSLNVKTHAIAKGHMKSASISYLQAGYKNASEYAKATLRLFDAYAFINQAESELDQETRATHYQMAENLLQIAAGSFMKSKQPEKTTQVQKILDNVREEKILASSLYKVMQAPTIASTTLSFSAPSPITEASVGLEQFEHANVQANLVSSMKEVKIGESFCLSLEFVNAGKEPALLTKVEDFIPYDFVVVKKPEIYRIEDTCLNMKGKQLAPLKLVEVKLVLQPSKKGKYQLNPMVQYLDELGQNRSLKIKTLEINVEEIILEDRVSTGTHELDSLLLGGLPEGYAVALTGPPTDEREYLVKNFLECGTKKNENVFYVSTESDRLENLLKNSNFYLFLCNPKPKTQVPELPNIFKLRSKTDLTNLSISLAKAYRNIDSSKKKRICVENISDVLLHYKADSTRNWVSELITDITSKGFTMLAVINPLMHTSEGLHAILDLFDGEINITQSDDPLDCKKSILVKKLRNQDYIKNPICLR